MITLNASQAAMLYLSLTLGALFSLWLIHHIKSKNQVILPKEEELHLCEYCHALYSAKISKSINKCPTCHSYNKSNRFRPKQNG